MQAMRQALGVVSSQVVDLSCRVAEQDPEQQAVMQVQKGDAGGTEG